MEINYEQFVELFFTKNQDILQKAMEQRVCAHYCGISED